MAETKGFSLADMLKDVSNLDTGANAAAPQQIELIPLDLVDQDPNNFYSLDGIDQLAASIELVGLQQPILVRPSGGRYVVISGHRRRAAAMLIRDGGSKQFETGIPCIVDRSEASEALRELQLIYANRDTRVLTSAELNKQAERVEMLLYELKEQGVEFPGRMRDHVAEACKLSRTKLARLKVIRAKLDPCFKRDYDTGSLSESAAYALAQQSAEAQRLIKKYEGSGPNGSKYLSEFRIKSIADWYKRITATPCAKDKLPCSHINDMMEQSCDPNYGPCKSFTCCNECYKLESCKAACPKLAEKVKRLKADKKAAAQQKKLAQVKKEKPHIDFISRVWQRFGYARKMAGMSLKQVQKKMDVHWYGDLGDEIKVTAWECGEGKVTPSTRLPFGMGVSYYDPERIVQLADILGCSTDYLLGRTEQMTLAAAQSSETALLKWTMGTPPESGDYVAVFDLAGDPYRQIAYYNSVTNTWHFPKSNASIQAPVICWLKLPEVYIDA